MLHAFEMQATVSQAVERRFVRRRSSVAWVVRAASLGELCAPGYAFCHNAKTQKAAPFRATNERFYASTLGRGFVVYCCVFFLCMPLEAKYVRSAHRRDVGAMLLCCQGVRIGAMSFCRPVVLLYCRIVVDNALLCVELQCSIAPVYY